MAGSKNITLQQLVMRVLFVFVVAAICMVSYAHADSDDSNLADRKLKEPQPNCAGLGEYCDLATWCCGTLECDRNPGITDWSGTCKQGACQTVGQFCGIMPGTLIVRGCCWGLTCEGVQCVAGNTESQGIHMVVSS